MNIVSLISSNRNIELTYSAKLYTSKLANACIISLLYKSSEYREEDYIITIGTIDNASRQLFGYNLMGNWAEGGPSEDY